MKNKGFFIRLPTKAICSGLSLLFVVSACQILQPQPQQTETASQPAALLQPSLPWVSDVPLLKIQHLRLDYWLDKIDQPNEVLLKASDIEQWNQHLINILPEVIDVFAEPLSYPAEVVEKMIVDLSHRQASPRFNQAGIALTEQDWQRYENMLGLNQLPALVTVQFALVTSRGHLRTFPTNDAVYSSKTDQQLDRFQETAVFPGEALQVLHLSEDRQWAFIRHYHYQGWLELKHFAIGEKSVVQQFVNATDFMVVTGAQVKTNASPTLPQASEIVLEMGVKLPRVRQHPSVVNGQNTSFSYVVKLPVQAADGRLQLVDALIARHQDISAGFLPLTKANILRQSFKFLGEHYGWGHALNARDCSGFIGEVYRSFGFILPRNTSTQGLATFGAIQVLADASQAEKLQALAQVQTGDLIFIPGHVMLVLGRENAETFVIHDVAGLHYFLPDGSLYHSMLNGVSITPLSPLQRNQQQSYLDGIYILKSLSREFYANPTN